MKVCFILILFISFSCTLSVSSDSDTNGLNIPAHAIKEELGNGIIKVSVNDGSGNSTMTGIIKNGNKQGNWIEYHPNALVKSITPYVDGKIEGLRTEFSNTGQLEKSLEYHNDQ